MTEPPQRRSLTPLSSELRFEELEPVTPSRLTRVRNAMRREERPPKTLTGVLAHGLLRLAVAVGVASALAALIDHLLHRNAALGFYIVGAFVLSAGIGMSTGTGRRPMTYARSDRERRVNLSFAYVLAGLIVIAIDVAIEASR